MTAAEGERAMKGRLADRAAEKIACALEHIRIYGTRAVNLDFDDEDNFVNYTYERLKAAERLLEEALEDLEALQ